MITFVAKFADINIEINAIYESTKDFCKDYVSDGNPEFSIAIDSEDIVFERDLSKKTSLKELGYVVNYSDEYLETLAVCRKISERMPEFGVFFLHGSAIAVDNQTYIFTAPSGTGKSTHVNLWRRKFGDKAVTVNDDKPFIKFEDNRVLACGSPWDGKHRLSNNIMVPLKAICILERGEKNQIEEVNRKEALMTLMQQIYIPQTPERTILCLKLIDRLLADIKIYRLKCNMEEEAATVSYEGMSK